ncbi:MAG: hypothetical protein WA934_12475 [Gordonia sp. (in: high G+C Gram-positive bacteria)]|uniref:hypothetical protein n=1 Tax=Gordonia sp. (in: high G+C Gram-positive bacteria) TaxID=84139 RepID=UPI003C76B74F
MAVATVSALTACSQSDEGPKENVPTVTPATAAQSPASQEATAGTVTPTVPAKSVVVAHAPGSQVAVLSNDGKSMQIFSSPGGPSALPPKVVQVPGLVDLVASGEGFVGVSPTGVVRVNTAGVVTEQQANLAGASAVAVDTKNRVLVGTDRGHVLVLDEAGKQLKDIGGFVRVDNITVAPASAGELAGQVVVLDRAQSAVAPVDIDTGELKAALRAGDGATESTVDDYGRVLVSGTRNNQVLAFYGQPIMMRLRAPVAESPYALAFDNQRKLLWVSTTANNEVTAYDLSTGEAIEKHRFASVPQVTSIDVDPASGNLLLVSGRDGALQVVTPDNVK